ncbi:MAG: MFS transporter, partial [Patescibacteria group bacterium]
AKAYYLFTFLAALGIGTHTTIYVLFLQKLGLNMSDVLLINAGFVSSMVILELPTGMLADGKSRLWSIRAGIFTQTLMLTAYAFCTGFWSALLVEIGLGVGDSFMSGARQAWITDALARRNQENDLDRVFGTAAIFNSTGFCGGGVIGAALGLIDFKLSWFAGSILAGASFLVSLYCMNSHGEPLKRISEIAALKQSLQKFKASPALIWAVICTILVMSFSRPMFYFWQPFFGPRSGQFGLAFVWIAITCSIAIGNYVIRNIGVPKNKEVIRISSSILIMGFGIAIIGHWPDLLTPLAIICIYNFGHGMFRPQIDVFEQRRVRSEYRATYGSLSSFLQGLGNALILFIFGFLLLDYKWQESVIVTVWTMCGALLTIYGIACHLLRKKIQD